MAGQLGAADANDRPTRLESHAPLSDIATACVPDPPLCSARERELSAVPALHNGVICATQDRPSALSAVLSCLMWCQGWVRPGLVSRSWVESRVTRRVSRAADAVMVR